MVLSVGEDECRYSRQTGKAHSLTALSRRGTHCLPYFVVSACQWIITGYRVAVTQASDGFMLKRATISLERSMPPPTDCI
jgi:hypothetical protein